MAFGTGFEMIEPTPKHPRIDDLLTAMTGKARAYTIRAHKCMTCTSPVNQFRDSLSLKEYQISGMCQACQDSVFGIDDTSEEPINV